MFFLGGDPLSSACLCIAFSLESAYVSEIDRVFGHPGTIPEDLEGTLLRNGPGLFEIGGIPVSQPFDGDGMVCFLYMLLLGEYEPMPVVCSLALLC